MENAKRIEDYAMVGDLHTAAMVSADGSIDWLCFPRFDSAACFAALVDDDRAGRWHLGPVGVRGSTRRRYRGDTLILETEWETAEGAVRVTDFMPVRDGAANLVRIVDGIAGEVAMRSELVLRFDYGHIVPWVTRTEGGIRAVAGPDAVLVTADVPLMGRDMRTEADFSVAEGDRVRFVLTWYPSNEAAPAPVDADQALAET